MNATVARILDGKSMTAASLGPVIQGLLEQVELANQARERAEQKAEAAHAARLTAEGARNTDLTAKAQAEGEVIRERETRAAAERKAQEADTRALRHEQLYMTECEKHETTKQLLEAVRKENGELRVQLATAQTEARARGEEIGRVPKPTVNRPPAYEVAWTDREGKSRTMTVTPRS